ncbi:hypothetical protein ACFL35_14920 [Candidatus Riflebacteria bacterium]
MNSLIIGILNIILAGGALLMVYKFFDPEIFEGQGSMIWVLTKSVVTINLILILIFITYGWKTFEKNDRFSSEAEKAIHETLTKKIGDKNLYQTIVQHRNFEDVQNKIFTTYDKSICRVFEIKGESGFLMSFNFLSEELKQFNYVYYLQGKTLFNVNNLAGKSTPGFPQKSIPDNVVFDTLHDIYRPPAARAFEELDEESSF